MNQLNGIVGVGCFACEATLTRILRRMIESCCLADGAEALCDRPGASAGSLLLGSLLSGGPGAGEKTIAGFFLSVRDRRLDLSVFTRKEGARCETFTADLSELSRLRRQRLN
jgi:hypothetical protein